MTFVRLQLESNLNPVLFCIVGQHSQLRRVPQPSPGYSRRFHKTPWQDQFGYCCLLPWLNKPVSFRQVQCHHCICLWGNCDSAHFLGGRRFPAFHSCSYHCSIFDGDFKFYHPFWGHCSGSVAQEAGASDTNKLMQTNLNTSTSTEKPSSTASRVFKLVPNLYSKTGHWRTMILFLSAAALVLAAQLNRGWGAGTRYVRCM